MCNCARQSKAGHLHTSPWERRQGADRAEAAEGAWVCMPESKDLASERLAFFWRKACGLHRAVPPPVEQNWTHKDTTPPKAARTSTKNPTWIPSTQPWKIFPKACFSSGALTRL